MKRSIFKSKDLITLVSQVRLMSYDDKSLIKICTELADQSMKFFGIGLIQVAGRFICQDYAWMRKQSSAYSSSLLFSLTAERAFY